METQRYIVIEGKKPPKEVTKEEFITTEQRGDFESKYPGEPATGGFSFEEWHDDWVQIRGIITSNHEEAERILRGEQ